MKHLFIIWISLLLVACESLERPLGEYDKIVVFSDEQLFNRMKEVLDVTLAAPHELPVTENRYKLERRPYEDFDRFKRYRNVLFLVAKDRPSPLNSFPDRILSENAKKAVAENRQNFFMAKNVYASEQALLLFVANDSKEAENLWLNQFTSLPTFAQFENYVLERVTDKMFQYGENTDSNQGQMQQLGYAIRHADGLTVMDLFTGPDSNLISFFGRSPIRWIWAKRFPNYQRNEIATEWVLDTRDYTMSTFFEGDSVDRLNVMYVDSNQADNLLYKRVQGVYKAYNDNQIIGGGPFITYAFLDSVNNQIYLVDGHIYNPGKHKSNKLLELEGIMRTFKIAPPESGSQ